MICGFCGHEFDAATAKHGCGGCGGGCHNVHCPRCDYKNPEEISFLAKIRGLFGKPDNSKGDVDETE